jgi:hypothetical protein
MDVLKTWRSWLLPRRYPLGSRSAGTKSAGSIGKPRERFQVHVSSEQHTDRFDRSRFGDMERQGTGPTTFAAAELDDFARDAPAYPPPIFAARHQTASAVVLHGTAKKEDDSCSINEYR